MIRSFSDDHTRADVTGIVKRLPPEPDEVDPLDDLKSAIDELIQFTAEDAINAGSFNPSIQGPNEPDFAGADDCYAKVLAEVLKLLAPKPAAQEDFVAPHPAPGILTTHDPSRRLM
jgi:hypothetical protein